MIWGGCLPGHLWLITQQSAFPEPMDVCWLHEDMALPSARQFTGAEGRRQTMWLSELAVKRGGVGWGAACRPEVHDQGPGRHRELFLPGTGRLPGKREVSQRGCSGCGWSNRRWHWPEGQEHAGSELPWQRTKLWLLSSSRPHVCDGSCGHLWVPLSLVTRGGPYTPPSALRAAAQTDPGLDQKEARRRTRARAETVPSEYPLATPLRRRLLGPWAPI